MVSRRRQGFDRYYTIESGVGRIRGKCSDGSCPLSAVSRQPSAFSSCSGCILELVGYVTRKVSFGSLGIGVVRVKIPHCIVIPHASGQAPERSAGSRSPPHEIPSLIAFGTGYSVRKPVPNLVRDDRSPTPWEIPKNRYCFMERHGLGEHLADSRICRHIHRVNHNLFRA